MISYQNEIIQMKRQTKYSNDYINSVNLSNTLACLAHIFNVILNISYEKHVFENNFFKVVNE